MYNIYWVDAGEYRYIEEYIDGFARYETARSCGYVVAETRGKAKARHIKAEAECPCCRIYIDFTDKVSIQKLKGGFETEADANRFLDGLFAEKQTIWEDEDYTVEERMQLLKEAASRGNFVITLKGKNEVLE